MLLARIPNSLSLSLSLPLSLSLSLNPFLFPSLLQSAFKCPHRADECKSWQVGQHCFVPMCGSPQDNLAYEFVPTSPAVLSMSCLSYLDGLVRWEISWCTANCFVGCCFKDSFSTICSMLVWFPSSFSSMCFVKIRMVQPYSSTDTATA